MRTRAGVPVTAPTPQQWQAWWAGLVGRLVHEVGLDGTDGAHGTRGTDGTEAWRPGARWDLTPAGLTRGTAEATVRTAGPGRAVTVVYREHADERRHARVDVDGLEQPRAATTSGMLAPVGWTGKASMAGAGPVVRLDLTLPWGRLRLRARVAGDRLDSELVVRGRGLWRPLAAVGLRLVRPQVRAELERVTVLMAAAVGGVARDPGAASAPDVPLGDGGSGGPEGFGTGASLDQALDVGWLRSPVTILSHLRRAPHDRL